MLTRNSMAFLAAVLLCGTVCGAQEAAGKFGTDPEALAAWQSLRFGMFIHWDPVSQKGTEISHSRGKEVPAAEYDQLYKTFNPQAFNADDWVKLARDAGMRYIVFTSKHHDGFCMWDASATDYDIMNTPFGRDVIGELSAACKKAGIPFGTYHSILDWYQPDYNTAGRNGGPGYPLPAGQQPDMERYQAYLEGQVRELASKYGPLLTMWFDGEWEPEWTEERGVRLLQVCREADPKMLVNNRVGKARQGMEGVTKADVAAGGDFDTPEQQVGAYNTARAWETCMTIGNQWAWKPGESIKSIDECIRTLVSTAGGDGNLLLNVGPMPDGRIAPEHVERLLGVGQWLNKHGETIYGTRGGPFPPGPWGCSTHKGDVIYVHVYDWGTGSLMLPPLDKKILSASFHDGGTATWTQSETGVELKAGKTPEPAVDSIVVLQTAP